MGHRAKRIANRKKSEDAWRTSMDAERLGDGGNQRSEVGGQKAHSAPRKFEIRERRSAEAKRMRMVQTKDEKVLTSPPAGRCFFWPLPCPRGRWE